MSNTKRTQLYKSLPLDTPFALHVFPSFYCNFRCSYCLHSLDAIQLEKKGFERQFMDMQTYEKLMTDVLEFRDNIKALIFAGHGEPLLNKDIPRMVEMAKRSGKFGRTEIVTNGYGLTKGMSDALIDAGLDRLRVSLQGVSSEKYREISGVDVSVDDIEDKLRYFYVKKKETEVYVKIIDIALNGDGDEKKFYERFRAVSDIAAVEYAIPFVDEIDYTGMGDLSGKTKMGGKKKSEICSMPFYMLVVNPNGDVVPCCATQPPIVFGNISESSLKEVWDGEFRKIILKRHLGGVKKIPICKNCSVPEFGLQEGDYLDGHEKELFIAYGF